MANQERQGGEAAEMAATPRIPLRELHELGRLVEAGVAGESPCDLLAATANAVKAALKSESHRDGWLLGQRDFIEAVRAIRDINVGGAVETYGATWAERWKALWSGLREALAAYTRAAGCEPRAPCLVIEADSISRDWNRPLDTGALTSLFKYCKAAAVTAFREEREVVGFRYDSGVYDVPLANHRGIARLETHAERLHKEHGDILETLQEIKAQGDRIEATGDETRGLAGEIRWNQMTAEEKRRLAGMAGAAKGAGATSPKIIKARDAAARDLQEACGKVKELIDKGASLDAACREVCDQFRELPGSKKGGKTWEPLLSARLDAKGSRIKMEPTSLMRRYGEWCKENGLPSPREQVKQAKTKKHGQ